MSADASRSVLIVDDVPEILELFERSARIYHEHPLEIVTLSDATVALDLVAKRKFDVVVCDFRMPGVDGIRLLAAARAHHPEGHRVLMTGYNEIPVDPAAIDAAGLSACLRKPMRGSSLPDLLKACFSEDPHALDVYPKTGAD